MKHYLYLMAMSLLVLWGCKAERTEDIELSILCTTDMHSKMLPYDIRHMQPNDGSLASFATMIGEVSNLNGRDRSLVLDMGNKAFSGMLNYYYNYVDSASHHLVFRSNALIGYEAMGLGARDLSYEGFIDLLQSDPRLSESYVCANLVRIGNLEPVLSPYKIIDRGGVRIAVLGLTTPQELQGEDMMKYEILDMIECAQHWMPEILSQHPDLVIGLFSCNTDYESFDRTLESYLNPAGGLPTAIMVPGFDLVFLHDCPAFNSSTVTNVEGKQVPCFAMATSVDNATLVRVRLHPKGEGYEKRIYGTNADLTAYAADSSYCTALQGLQDSLLQWFDAPLGTLVDTIYAVRGMFGSDAYANFLHRLQMFDGLADLTINACMLGTDTFPAGPLSMRRIFDLYPFENELEYLQLSGEEVLRALEWMAERQYDRMLPGEEPHILTYARDRLGRIRYDTDGVPFIEHDPVSYCSMGGINYTIDLSRPVGNRVHVHGLANGAPLSLTRLYTVAVNSYMVRNGHGFVTEGLRWDVEKLAYRTQTGRRESMRSAAARLVRSLPGDSLRVSRFTPNWSLAPYDFVSKQIRREMSHPMRLHPNNQ